MRFIENRTKKNILQLACDIIKVVNKKRSRVKQQLSTKKIIKSVGCSISINIYDKQILVKVKFPRRKRKNHKRYPTLSIIIFF